MRDDFGHRSLPDAGLSIIEAMEDDFAAHFQGDSWNTHKAVLKAMFHLPMSGADRQIFFEISGGRQPPRRRVRECWQIIGRGGGKSAMASLTAVYAAMCDWTTFLRAGERATIAIIACDREQSKICMRYTRALLREPLLASLIEREDADSIELSNGAEILVATNSFRTVRGRSYALVICDECAFYRDEASANPDVEVVNAVLPGLARMPGSMLIGISSPYKRSGILFEKFSKYFGRDDDSVLVVKGSSLQFNSTLDPQIIADALERDPAAARSEWLCEWRSDLSGFLDPSWIDRAAQIPAGGSLVETMWFTLRTSMRAAESKTP